MTEPGSNTEGAEVEASATQPLGQQIAKMNDLQTKANTVMWLILAQKQTIGVTPPFITDLINSLIEEIRQAGFQVNLFGNLVAVRTRIQVCREDHGIIAETYFSDSARITCKMCGEYTVKKDGT